MARGTPVVANAIGDMGRIVTEAHCGVVVDETDPEAICEGIERLGRDSKLRAEMASNAVRVAKERYTWEAVRPDFLAAYGDLCSKASCDRRTQPESPAGD
jgi:glycosyltransferase involved in cell wall biosynthesis